MYADGAYKWFGATILISSLVATAGAVGCVGEPSVPPGAASRPAYPPKRMANVHDVVAYVEAGEAIEGNRAHQTVYEGGLYYFANPENRAKFAADPGRYTPAYNGWCSCGMAKGMRLPASGKDFEVVDGQLYLFHNAAVKAEWKKDMSTMLSKADQNWVDLR
ncbi:MAG: YHS domain-containing (seleno)protein [Myxococcota bacterium]